MQNLELQEKKVQIKQIAGAELYWQFKGIQADVDARQILIRGKRISIVDGEKLEIDHNYIVSNYSFRVPVVDSAGDPVMITETYLGENGMEQIQQVQKTIGEFDMWFKKVFEPVLWPSIQLGAMVDLKLLESNPLTYTEI